ncbi:MAG: hypothetical protein O7B35_04820 [Deltaproteobacteria bacterium]|nr:hypothetical protein [Deltaproteobacteria bacterium]
MKRKIVFVLLAAVFYSLAYYITFVNPTYASWNISDGFGIKALVFFMPLASALSLWIWGLYDWGTRTLTKGRKIIWLLVILATVQFGATLYFLVVGLKPREDSK